MVDIVIVGAGISGTFIAKELARYKLNIIILDRENDVANETTMANSAIIHAGYDALAGTNKGLFNSKGNARFDELCEELDVPFKRCGSLVVGFDKDDKETIRKLYENGLKNKVPDMKILNNEEVKMLEPNLNALISCALFAPTAGIISPWELAIAFAENAVDNGVKLRLETTVIDIEKSGQVYTVITDKGSIKTKYIINCAGVYADKINNMVAEPYFEIHPRKGNYYVLDKEVGDLVNHVIFRCPTDKGKGVLITPTVHGNILIGPDSEFVEDKDDVSTNADSLKFVKESAQTIVENIPFNKVIRSFSGLRASVSKGDFIIEEVKEAKGFVNVAGFDSPGLSSIPAVAEYVVDLMKDITGGMELKDDFNPKRRKVVRFAELSEESKTALIKENPRYGRIICRCENITEAEIMDSIHRNVGAKTVKGVKKRTRPGTGRCQGSFCGPRVVEILARELSKDMKDISYDSSDAYLLSGETKDGEKKTSSSDKIQSSE